MNVPEFERCIKIHLTLIALHDLELKICCRIRLIDAKVVKISACRTKHSPQHGAQINLLLLFVFSAKAFL